MENNQTASSTAQFVAGAVKVASVAGKIVLPIASVAVGTVVGMLAFNKYFKKD